MKKIESKESAMIDNKKEEAWRMFHLRRHFEMNLKKTNPKP